MINPEETHFLGCTRPPRRRRGGVYLVVLSTALIVSVLGLTALSLQRINRQSYEGINHANQARLLAQAALRMGMLRIENDPDWRFTYSNGVLASDVPLGDGTYTVEVLDRTDGDLSDDAEDPVVLIGTGRMGDAMQKMEITLAAENRGLNCLEAAIYSGHDLHAHNASVYCDQTLSAARNVDANPADVYCDVEAVTAVKGSTYHAATRVGIDPRELPDSVDVFQYYLEHGTEIDFSALPTEYPNLLDNPGFEDGGSHWTTSEGMEGADIDLYCEINADYSGAHSGSACLRVDHRHAWNAGPVQYLTGEIKNGYTYDFEVWVKMASGPTWAQLSVNTNGTSSGDTWFVGGETNVNTSWKRLTMSKTLTWSGELTRAFVKIETENGAGQPDFYIDDLVVREQSSGRIITRVLLSPESNPYGAETNPEGIYIIDCSDNDIYIDFARIYGTLVLLRPHRDSRIGNGGPLCWQPAIPNMPVLLVKDKDANLNPSNLGLSEAALVTNFNPAGTPFEALGEDSDHDDTYTSQINGLIYGTNKVEFLSPMTMIGTVVAGGNVEIRADFDLNWDSRYLVSPPPGFSGPEQIKILLDSVKKVVD